MLIVNNAIIFAVLICVHGGIGRRASLRGLYPIGCAGSTPVVRTFSVTVKHILNVLISIF